MDVHNPDDRQWERISQMLIRLVEGRDPDLLEHHEGVGRYSAQLAQAIGLPSEEVDVLTLSARIHDIGKMVLSEHILNKPTRLTPAEFFLVKQHPSLGGHLIESLTLDPRISSVVVLHHENFDGSGYPQGLQGDAIPLFARIVRITDSFDALTSERPYHRAVRREEAIALLRRDAHCYDRTLLDTFCDMMTQQQSP